MASGVVSPHEQGVPVTSAQEAGGGQRADLLEQLQCVCVWGGEHCCPGAEESFGFSRPSAQIRAPSLWEKVTVPLG